MRVPRGPLLYACAALISLAFPASAGGLFWSDRFSGNQNIRACNFDGSNVRNIRSVGLSDPRGVVVDNAGGRIYFITRSGGILQSVDFANANYVQHVTGLTAPADLRLDTANRVLYWCEETAGTIRKAALPPVPQIPGTLLPQGVFSGLSAPYYLDLDVTGGRLYWGQNGASIFSGPIGGGTPDPAIYSSGSDNRGVCVDVPRGMLYWAERGNRVVRRRRRHPRRRSSCVPRRPSS